MYSNYLKLIFFFLYYQLFIYSLVFFLLSLSHYEQTFYEPLEISDNFPIHIINLVLR